MRRVIRKVTSHEYFRDGQWTLDPLKAEEFCNSGEAIETCLRYHLHDVELVLQLQDLPQEAYDTHLRLFDGPPVVSPGQEQALPHLSLS